MKQLIFTLMIVSVFLSSCKEEPEKIDYIWTGQENIRQLVPVCIVWYKRSPQTIDFWKPYKTWSQTDAEQMRTIIWLIRKPEKREPNPSIETNNKLSLIFYIGFPEELTVREVYFELQGKTFIGPRGKSDRLAQLLFKGEKVKRFYYPRPKFISEQQTLEWVEIMERIPEAQKSMRKGFLKAQQESYQKEIQETQKRLQEIQKELQQLQQEKSQKAIQKGREQKENKASSRYDF